MSKLIFGCGYLGLRVAERWRREGDDVYVVTRSDERAAVLARQGYAPVVADVTRPETLTYLPQADSVLWAVGFDRNAGPAMRDVYVDGLQSTLDAVPPALAKFVYISSTGVYGQTQDEWVDEDSATIPDREGGQLSLAAEQLLLNHSLGGCAIVLRMAGLYGPGRVPYLNDLRGGQPIPAASEGYLNLIHVGDAASVVVAAEMYDDPPATFLVSDGCPVVRGEYIEEVARQIGAPKPIFAPPAADSAAAARAGSSKRIKNDRMLKELGVVLKYPTYRQGLAAILATADQA